MSQNEIINTTTTNSSASSTSDQLGIDSSDEELRPNDQISRQESVIRSPTQQSMPCFLSNTTSISPQNPFSKTSTSSVTAGCGQQSLGSVSGRDLTERSSVILAPARLNTNSSLNNNINNNLIGFQSQQSSKLLLRPSVLRVADSSTNNSQNAQKEGKVFAFVSLSKEDISRPATTLLQSDIIRCGADTTSPFNGEEAPPVSSTSDVPTIDDNDSNSQSFVFGENLEDRAVFINKTHEINDNINSNDLSHKRLKIDEQLKNNSEQISKTDSNTGEQNCNDFKASTSASSDSDLSSVKKTSDGVLDLSSNSDSGDKSENKRKYEVITGEEDEQNVLAMYCRLYGWDSETSSWIERGRGSLRLNDIIKDDKLCSRIVMRTSGALRVILNAHIMAGMKFELSNEQCLRFTNVDGIYLIKGATKDIDQLNSAIDYRLREISKRLKSDSPQHQTIEDMSNDSCISNK